MPPKDPKSLIRIAREGGMQEIAEPLNLGSRVRSLRKARNWTLEQAAQQAGLARSTLSKIENGQMSPTYDALKKLAIGLEISIPQRRENQFMFCCSAPCECISSSRPLLGAPQHVEQFAVRASQGDVRFPRV